MRIRIRNWKNISSFFQPMKQLLLLRVAGIILPIYIILKAVTSIIRRRQQQAAPAPDVESSPLPLNQPDLNAVSWRAQFANKLARKCHPIPLYLRWKVLCHISCFIILNVNLSRKEVGHILRWDFDTPLEEAFVQNTENWKYIPKKTKILMCKSICRHLVSYFLAHGNLSQVM